MQDLKKNKLTPIDMVKLEYFNPAGNVKDRSAADDNPMKLMSLAMKPVS